MKANKTYSWWRFWAYKSELPASLHRPAVKFQDFGIRKILLLTLKDNRPITILLGRKARFYVYQAYAPADQRKWFRWVKR